MRKILGLFGVVLTVLGIFVMGAYAQQLYIGASTPENPAWIHKGDFDGSIILCRGYFDSTVPLNESGSGWWTDYPGADNNFMTRISELTEVRVRFDPERRPFYRVVRLDDPELFMCPVLFMEDPAFMRLTVREIENLQRFFAKGGFLWVDDFWGSAAWENWDVQIRQVLPSAFYPWEDIPTDDMIYSTLYRVPPIWQQPYVQFWMAGCGGDSDDYPDEHCHSTSERGDDSLTPTFRGLRDEHGRLFVVVTHNTDIADGWEEEKPENMEYINEFSARSYALGINIFLYGLTH